MSPWATGATTCPTSPGLLGAMGLRGGTVQKTHQARSLPCCSLSDKLCGFFFFLILMGKTCHLCLSLSEPSCAEGSGILLLCHSCPQVPPHQPRWFAAADPKLATQCVPWCHSRANILVWIFGIEEAPCWQQWTRLVWQELYLLVCVCRCVAQSFAVHWAQHIDGIWLLVGKAS